MEIQVARLSGRRASRRQKAREVRAERVAQAGLRWLEVELADPERRQPAVRLNLVHVREESEPAGAERLEWFLLTMLAVASREDVERVLEWYRLRWRIEDWQPVLKSGCKVEDLGHRRGGAHRAGGDDQRGDRLAADGDDAAGSGHAGAAGGDAVEIEIAALADFAKDRGLAPPDNLGRAVLTLAMLGG